MNEAGWAAIAVAFLTGAGSLYTALTTKRKIDADSESISVTTALDLVKAVRAELSLCQSERSQIRRRLENAERRIDHLGDYIRLNHGIDPEAIGGDDT